MDIKAEIEKIVKKIKEDKDFGKKFQENPTKAIEGIIGVDLPDEEINKMVNAIQAKLTADNIGRKLDNILGKLK